MLTLLRSPKLTSLGFVHGFGTRHADVGSAATPALRQTALAQLKQAANGVFDFAEVEQVHGKDVASPTSSGKSDVKADAVRIATPNVAAAIRTADCVPVLLAHRRSGAVVAAHAGWRGLVAGVIEEAIRSLGDGREIVCAIGPCISATAFEIGPEVAESLVRKVDDTSVVLKKGESHYGDLQLAVKLVLGRMNVPFSSIDRLEHCTFTEEDLFFSHRRDRTSGRQLSFIAPTFRSTP